MAAEDGSNFIANMRPDEPSPTVARELREGLAEVGKPKATKLHSAEWLRDEGYVGVYYKTRTRPQ